MMTWIHEIARFGAGTRFATHAGSHANNPLADDTLAAAAFLLGSIAAGSGSLRAAWEPIARFVSLQDPPRPASANVLSEHEISALDDMPPQSQAELLLERSINHYRGANDQIAARVNRWRGRITWTTG